MQAEDAIDYRRALVEAAAYLERLAEAGRPEPDLLASCPDSSAVWGGLAYPMPALDPARQRLR